MKYVHWNMLPVASLYCNEILFFLFPWNRETQALIVWPNENGSHREAKESEIA
jgi:hypothetical protein